MYVTGKVTFNITGSIVPILCERTFHVKCGVSNFLICKTAEFVE